MLTTGAKTRTRLGTALALACLVLSGLAVGASPAAAATPCWKLVLNDWFVDGRIDKVYPSACYTQAQKHLGEDAKVYSTLPNDLRRGLLASLHQGKLKAQQREANGQTSTDSSGALVGGGGGPNGGAGGGASGGPSGDPGTGSADSPGFLTRAIRSIGPSDATSIPTPLLVLAGVAVLLLLAALASWFARRYQSRRLRPAPAAPPPRKRT